MLQECVRGYWMEMWFVLSPDVPLSTSQAGTLEPSNPGDSPRSGEGA